MKISYLKKLFTRTIDILSFKNLINDEIMLYERLYSKKGSSIPIDLIEDGMLFFGKNEFMFLCKSYISEELSQYEIAYIVEAILLSSCVEFENNFLEEELDFFCDIERNEKLSKADVVEIMNRVASC